MSSYSNLNPENADLPHVTAKKILQRLNTGVTPAGLYVNGNQNLHVQIPRDLFGRVEVATPTTLFDSKFDISDRSDKWNAEGTTAHDPSRARIVLTVAALSNTTSARQTRRSIIYQPGKQQSGVMTFRLGSPAAGITRRVGLFESQHGIFLEQTVGGLSFVIREDGAASESASQANWNADKLDGTGASGVILDQTKCQILVIAYEWLGVGTVSCGFFHQGEVIWAHHFHHANVVTQVYVSTPNAPIRYEISNDGTGAESTFDQICSTVYSSGGVQNQGRVRSVDRETTPLTTLNDSDIYPLLAIRLSDVRANCVIENLSVMSTDNTALWQWQLILNPTVAGTALSFSTYSEFVDVARPTNATKVSGGTLLGSGYAVNSLQSRPSVSVNPADDNIMGEQSIGGATDVMVLAVRRITGTTVPFYGSLIYREFS